MTGEHREIAKEHVARCPLHGPYPAHFPRCPKCN